MATKKSKFLNGEKHASATEKIDPSCGLSVGISADKVAEDKWYSGKRELTVREQQQRDRDCKVEYSAVVPTSLHKALDAERRANWIPPSEVEKMPVWTPTLTPLVQGVIDESVKEVALFMEEPAKEDREKIVLKLKAKVLKKDGTRDPELVEKALWRMLFDLQKDQGVSIKGKLFK